MKLPSSVDTIKESAFAFSNLEYVEIDDNVTTLPYGLFNNAIKLRSVKLPSACKNIPPKGFTNCTSLESIELPDTLERIGSYAFENSGIKSLEIPDSVTEIGSNAFENADKLESITLPSGLKKIDSNLFAGCTSLKKIILPENVNDIWPYAFSGCTNLTELELPEGLLRIGESAFSRCGIGELKIPDSVNSLTNPFRGSNIKNIIYSDTRTELPMNAYSGASKLESVKLPSKLTAIPDHAFTDCISLEKVDIPSSVNKIGKYAFNNCGIKKLNLSGNNIETIGNHAFERARLEYVELPDTVTVIEDGIFLKCNSLTQIQLPAALTTIGTSAFSNCASLKEIEIPDTVTSIGNAAFGNCVKLESIELPESLTALNTNLFMNCMELKNVKLPNGIDSINYGTFSGCSSLESITLPDSLTSIGTKAFESSGLTSLCIPASVKTIDNSAFLNSNIDTIYGYAGSIAETVAEKNGFKFVGLEEKTWNEKGSLPTSGIYKLECDVIVDDKISISSFLDLDLNGHNVVVKGMNVSGDMTIRDSSKDKTGSISSSDSGVLFNVDGILKLMGGTLTGNENNSSVVDLKAKSRFILDGGKIISYSGYSLSIDTGKASVDLISGSVEAVDKNIAKPDFNRSAIYIKEGYSGTLKLDGAVINADNGFGIYSESYDGTLDITGGSISSKKYYGIYCLKGTKTAVSGKINISGDAAGIYIAENQMIDVKGSLADSKIIINAAKTSIITNGYAEFNEGIDPTTIFMAVKGEKISLDKSGEVFCEVPVHSEHGDAETTTTTTFAATSTTTTSTTSMTTASSTSSSTTSSSTTSTTTTSQNASAVIIPETLTESVPPPPHRLDIQGDMTVKEMSLADLKKAGINLEDASNYHVFEYDLEMKFEAKTVHIKKFDIIGDIGGTDYIDAPPIQNGLGKERPNGSGRLQPVVTIDDKPAKVIDYVETEKEEMYMVISGECKWLKEFFDVQLIVINKDSSHESLTGCSATLNVPDGLSLVNCENTQNIGVLASNSAYTVNWYVRGDKAGEIMLLQLISMEKIRAKSIIITSNQRIICTFMQAMH